MLQNARSKMRAVSILLFAVIILTMLAAFLTRAYYVRADDSSDMRALLQRLDDQMRKQKGFLVTFDFNVSPNEHDKSWTLNDPKDKERFTISEIGSNYACFQRWVGDANSVICTPFSNIVSIFYLAN